MSRKDHKPAVLSPELKAFYESHSVEAESILEKSSVSRFIRVNPRFDEGQTLSLLQEKEGFTAVPVPWLRGFGFYAVPSSVKLSQSECFRTGRVYGMDVSSGAAVAVLMTNKFDDEKKEDTVDPTPSISRVLDICCAPGLKLCMLADILNDNEKNAVIIGVDIAIPRLNICKNIIQKYHGSTSSTTVRLYCGDGVTFGTEERKEMLFFDSEVAVFNNETGKRKRMNKSARARERKRLKLIGGESSQPMGLFDRVLVDAECSTDGSLKHILHQPKKRTDDRLVKNEQLIDDQQLRDLVTLQKGLIASGFRLLKPGGTLVYSTCSLSTAQNEGVVKWLLEEKKDDASLVPLKFPREKFIGEGSIKGTIRFKPIKDNTFGGGGFFVAKICKRAS